MPNRPLTICLVYGFCEGPRTGRPLVRRLEKAGYRIVNDARRADIVVGHSGGCFLLPDHPPGKLSIMIGLPHWPGKTTLRALAEKNRDEFRYCKESGLLGSWLRKFGWNIIYFWKLPTNIAMLRARQRGKFWHLPNLILIRNRDDRCCTPDIADLAFTRQPAYLALEGHHDDVWLHPDHYVDIINYYAQRLLA